MPPENKPKVKIKIVKRFVDEQGGRLFAPGIWEVDPRVSMRLVANGRATLVDPPAAATKAAPAKTPPAPPTNPRIPPVKEPEGDQVTETPLPDGFPCQATLAVAGYSTVESLKVEGIKEKLGEVEGLTPADVTKIGLAIAKV